MKKIIPILFYVLLLTACNKTDSDAEHRIWQEMKICGTVECYQSYLDKYPNGDYVVAVPEKVISAIQAAKDKVARMQASRKQAAKVRVALIENMVTIPSGRFQMGSNNGDDDETPVHEVRIDSFKMQAHEVTWNLYQPCIDAGVCSSDGDAGWGKGNRPVINVSWDDIQTYIQWLNQQTDQRFRLPSEAQWEYAARAGTSTPLMRNAQLRQPITEDTNTLVPPGATQANIGVSIPPAEPQNQETLVTSLGGDSLVEPEPTDPNALEPDPNALEPDPDAIETDPLSQTEPNAIETNSKEEAERNLEEIKRKFRHDEITEEEFLSLLDVAYDKILDSDSGVGDGKNSQTEETIEVGSFAPNAWGLYDMHGNVSEWVQDCYHYSYRGAPSDGSAWTTGECQYRVLRGGSWRDRAVSLRAAGRSRDTASTRDNRYRFSFSSGPLVCLSVCATLALLPLPWDWEGYRRSR